MKNKTVIVIGAGVAGLATAVSLAHSGFKVKVFEKNPEPGGRCGRILRDGHRFDLGATIFLMPSIYKDVFEYLGISLDKELPSKPLPVIYRLFFSDSKQIDFTTDKNHLREQLESIEKGSYDKSLNYISNGYYNFKTAYKDLLGKNFYSLFDFINLKNIKLLINLKTYKKHKSYAAKFFKNSNLKTAFTFQNIYVGQNPMTAPALFAMLPAAELTEGSLFPEGGMNAIVELLKKKADELGVDFVFNCGVEKILTEDNKVSGVKLENGEIKLSDIIVANADLPYVYKELLTKSLKTRLLDFKKYSCSAIVYHWGLDKQYNQLGHHSVFISSQYKKGLKAIFKNNSMSDEPSFYVHSPAKTDKTAAPDGHESISVIIPVGHITNKNEDEWIKLRQTGRKAVIERLKKEGLNDIEEHIKFEICYLPQTWKSLFNVSKGSVFGSINHSIMQMGYFRPHNRHSDYKNLYFAGGSTHPGNGVPLVLLSAKLTSQRIVKDNKQ